MQWFPNRTTSKIKDNSGIWSSTWMSWFTLVSRTTDGKGMMMATLKFMCCKWLNLWEQAAFQQKLVWQTSWRTNFLKSMHTLSGKIISQYLDTTNCSEILSRNEIVKNWAWEKKKLFTVFLGFMKCYLTTMKGRCLPFTNQKTALYEWTKAHQLEAVTIMRAVQASRRC